MTKNEFIQELGYLLMDIPEEERNEALEFYRNYFEEAGLEEEETVIKELGSPKDVAYSIKKSLEYGSTEEGYFSESGYYDSYQEKPNLPVFNRANRGEKDIDPNKSDNKSEETTNTERSSTGKDTSNNNSYKEGNTRDYNNKLNKGNKVLLIILLIIALPMAIPVAATVFGLFVAAFATMFSLWLAFFAVSVALLIVGIALAISGVVQLSVAPALGLSLAGGGLIALGVGIFFGIATIWMAGKAIPATINWIKMIWRRIFHKRRVYA